jgi:hypothetical protein
MALIANAVSESKEKMDRKEQAVEEMNTNREKALVNRVLSVGDVGHAESARELARARTHAVKKRSKIITRDAGEREEMVCVNMHVHTPVSSFYM